MARRDVINYYLEQQNVYREMLENLNEMKAALDQNKIDEERYNQYINDIKVIKDNYERLSYIMVLLNKPKRKSKKLNEYELSLYNLLETSSKEAILDESNNALADLKSLIEMGKEI